MTTINSVTFVGGLVFMAYIIFAGAYWAEAARWADKVMHLPDKETRAKARENRRRAEQIFRLCTGIAVVTIVIIILPVYIPNEALAAVCKWILLAPLAAMVILCLRYTRGNYFLPIDLDD